MSATPPPVPVPLPFAYDGQTEDGQRLSGTIEATTAEGALDRLHGMRLRVTEVTPAKPLAGGKRMSGDDFASFNQQLAQLTAAGMPLEQGLRMIAADLGRGSLRRTIDLITAELEGGTPLDQAFDKHQKKFPPLYGRLVRAGVKSGNLSAVLLSLGKHLDLVQRLRATLVRAIAYPLVVLISMGFLLCFLGIAVLPQLEHIYADFHIRLPAATSALLSLTSVAPALLVTMIVLIVLAPIVWGILQSLGYAAAVTEWLILPLPLIGPVLRANLVSRWCDGVKLGVDAGLDLPTAIRLGNDAAGSKRLARDGAALTKALADGAPLTSAPCRLLPPTVPAALQFASGFNDLGATLESLAELYRRRAETSLVALPGILSPLLILLIALIIGFVILALFAPLVAVIEGTMGISRHR